MASPFRIYQCVLLNINQPAWRYQEGTREQWPNSRKPKKYYIQGSDRHLQKANDQLTLAANTNWSQRPWAHTIAWTCCLPFTNKHLCFESWLLMTIWNKSIHLNLGSRMLNQQIIALAQGRRYRLPWHLLEQRFCLCTSQCACSVCSTHTHPPNSNAGFLPSIVTHELCKSAVSKSKLTDQAFDMHESPQVLGRS